MLDRIKNIGFIRGSSAIGIQVTFHSADKFALHLIKTVKRLGKISIESQAVELSSFDDIKKYLKKNTPVVLCVDGKNVIHRYITEDIGANPLDLVLPNASKDDFYIQQSECGNGHFLSVIRRENLESLISSFLRIDVIPAMVYLGPFVLSYTKFLFDDGLKFRSELWEINGTVDQITYSQSAYKDLDFTFVNGESIRACLFPAYALSVSYLANIGVDEIKVSSKYQDDFIFKRAIWLAGWSILIAIFTILLVNFMVFSNYNDKFEAANNMLQQHQSLLSRNDELKDLYTKKRKFIERSGLLTSSRFSYYSDRIARLVPDSVQLTSIQIFPVDDKVRSDKPIMYDENRIIVAGNCSNSRYFNIWKDNLKLENWLQDIYINQFGQEQPDKPIYFEIILEIK
ncbi:MAG: hypothetical protein KBA50_03105 [Sedimentibacter sp.]|nr:hypothetical protein [Sedimentibacter sp.]